MSTPGTISKTSGVPLGWWPARSAGSPVRAAAPPRWPSTRRAWPRGTRGLTGTERCRARPPAAGRQRPTHFCPAVVLPNSSRAAPPGRGEVPLLPRLIAVGPVIDVVIAVRRPVHRHGRHIVGRVGLVGLTVGRQGEPSCGPFVGFPTVIGEQPAPGEDAVAGGMVLLDLGDPRDDRPAAWARPAAPVSAWAAWALVRGAI